MSILPQEVGTAMLNSASLHAVNNAKFSQKFVMPLYDSYCFANLPQTIEFLLSGRGQNGFPPDVFGSLPTSYNKVILFFIDAFGWRFFAKYAEKYEFLKTVLKYGVVSKLTSQFPSTTAAHVTCIHTGLNVGQSGVYEWNYYEPLVDEVITPLLFSYAGDKERDSLKRSGTPSDAFYPHKGKASAHIFFRVRPIRHPPTQTLYIEEPPSYHIGRSRGHSHSLANS